MVACRRIRRRKINISSAWGILAQNLVGGGKMLPAGCPFLPRLKTISNPFIQFLHLISPIVTIHAPLTIFFPLLFCIIQSICQEFGKVLHFF
jgi:hypothetical protein